MGEVFALDSSAIIALARGDELAVAYLDEGLDNGRSFVVPAPVLAEVLRGTRRDASVHRVLNAVHRELATTPNAARRAGTALGRAGLPSSAALDALILETAIEHRCESILTQDLSDMRKLAAGRIAVLGMPP